MPGEPFFGAKERFPRAPSKKAIGNKADRHWINRFLPAAINLYLVFTQKIS